MCEKENKRDDYGENIFQNIKLNIISTSEHSRHKTGLLTFNISFLFLFGTRLKAPLKT